jgi:hypothetical protein
MRMAAVEVREIIDVAYAALPLRRTKKPLVLPADPDDDPVLISRPISEGRRSLARPEIGRARDQDEAATGRGSGHGDPGRRQRRGDQGPRRIRRACRRGEASTWTISRRLSDRRITIIRPGLSGEGGMDYLVKAAGSVDAAWKIGEFPITPGPTGGRRSRWATSRL